MRRFENRISARLQAGVSSIEYALLAALIALAIMISLRAFASNAVAMWANVSETIVAAIGGG